MIEDLASKIPDRPAIMGKVDRNDWRPVWSLCKAIQEAFKGTRDFASREDQQAAWERFSELRKRASETADREKEAFFFQSDELRKDIMGDLKGLRWEPIDDILFFFDPTTVEDMKRMQAQLKEAGRRLSENKQWMLKEHKDRIFERMQEIRASHDHFWEKRREYSQVRRQEHERKQAEFEERKEAWIRRTEANISRNREKLAKAEAARDRTEDRIREIEGKIYETDSDKWRDIFGDWLSEAQAKLSNIEESIDRIRGWISEDEDRLSGA